MKHIFVANPAAGKKNSVEEIKREVARFSDRYDVSVYETVGRGDATRFVKEYCETHPEDEVRFYGTPQLDRSELFTELYRKEKKEEGDRGGHEDKRGILASRI